MVEVSEKWRENQDSTIRCQGYVIVTLTDENKVSNTFSSLNRSNVTNIATTKWQRSYSPMSTELPSSIFYLELYNYDNQYIDYYKNYNGQPIRVTVKYGYKYADGTTEEISGGAFNVTNITAKDKKITFECKSSLECVSDKVTIETIAEPSTQTVPITKGPTSSAGHSTTLCTCTVSNHSHIYEDTRQRFSTIIDSVTAATGLKIDHSRTALADNSFIAPSAQTLTATEAFQYVLNANLPKAVIERDDTVKLYDIRDFIINDVLLDADILLDNDIELGAENDYQKYGYTPVLSANNMLGVPILEMSRQMKNIACSYPEQQYVNENAPTMVAHSGSNEDYFVVWNTDIVDYAVNVNPADYEPVKIDVYAFGLQTDTIEVTRDNVNNKFIVHFVKEPKRGTVDRYYRVDFYYVPIDKTTDTSIQYNDYGTECDMQNKLSEIMNYDKVAKYYSNREIYTLDVRGDPSVDVGDYVAVAINPGDELRAALILSSTLTFDGSFKDKLCVRMIDTSFESSR